MAIRVKLPNGQYGSFPDDMPHDQIEAVLQKQFPQQSQQPEESEQGFLNKLPRNLAAGATRGLAGLANIPYDIASISGGLQHQDPYEQRLMKSLGEKQQKPNADRIPHFGEHDYSKMFGITGKPTTSDRAIQFGTELLLPVGGALKGGYKGLKAASEAIPALTSKGIAKQVSADKTAAKSLAKQEYGDLFKTAYKQGLDKVRVPDIQAKRIIDKSLPRYHEALLNFKNNPNIETAHWAQSDLGAFKRHLDKLDATRGLTSTEHKTYKDVVDAQSKIKEAMFPKTQQKHPESIFENYESGNSFGVTANPEGTFLPNNTVGMIKKGDRAVVIDAKVKDQGKGLGKDLYRKAIESAKDKGLKFESDDTVSESALNVYKSLEKEGYKFKFNTDLKKFKREDGQIAYQSAKDDTPVVELLKTPSKNNPLMDKYNKLSNKYKETVIPYDSLKQLRNYEEGKLLPKDLIKHLKNNKAFRATLMDKYPGIKLNEIFNSKAAKYSAGLLAALSGWKGVKSLVE